MNFSINNCTNSHSLSNTATSSQSSPTPFTSSSNSSLQSSPTLSERVQALTPEQTTQEALNFIYEKPLVFVFEKPMELPPATGDSTKSQSVPQKKPREFINLAKMQEKADKEATWVSIGITGLLAVGIFTANYFFGKPISPELEEQLLRSIGE